MNIKITQPDSLPNPFVRAARIVWEIPLALLSYGFYKVIRFIMRLFVRLFPTAGGQKNNTWRILNADTLQSRFVLPVMMTSAPRWNTHAIIAIAGPWFVNNSIRLVFPEGIEASLSWTVNRITDHVIVASGNVCNDLDPQPIVLSPGRYRLTLRCYECKNTVQLPCVEVDGMEIVTTTAVPPAAASPAPRRSPT